MTIAEQRFLEMVPTALRDLVKVVENLTKEVAELKEALKKVEE